MLGQFFFQIEFSGKAFILIEEHLSKHLSFIRLFVQYIARAISKNDRTEICYQSDECQQLSFLFFLYTVIHSFDLRSSRHKFCLYVQVLKIISKETHNQMSC